MKTDSLDSKKSDVEKLTLKIREAEAKNSKNFDEELEQVKQDLLISKITLDGVITTRKMERNFLTSQNDAWLDDIRQNRNQIAKLIDRRSEIRRQVDDDRKFIIFAGAEIEKIKAAKLELENSMEF
jgi:structural maintenance of chromosome 2